MDRKRRNIPWILVLPPCTRNFAVLLIDGKAVVLEMTLKLVCKNKTRCTGTDANDTHVAFGVDWTS